MDKPGFTVKEEFKILLKNITKFKKSTLAKYFLGDEAAIQSLSQWITKESENYYFINRKLIIWKHLIEFMKQDQGGAFKQPNDMTMEKWNEIINELNFFGFKDYYHYPNDSKIIRWKKF